MKYLNNQKGIITIVAVLGVGVFALASSFTMAAGALQQLVLSRDNISTGQAFYTAEAAASEGIYQLVSADKTAEEINGSTIGENGDAINENTLGNIMALPMVFGIATVSGDAEKGDTTRIVANIIRNYPDNDGFAFDYGLYTPQEINMNGSALVHGNVFASDEFWCKGKENNNKCMCGPGAEDPPKCVDGVIVEYEDEEIPEFNWQDYYDLAYPDTYFEDVSEAKAYIEGDPADKVVVFVENPDDRLIFGATGTSLFGSLWVTGDLKLTGGTVSASEDYLAIMVEGNLEIVGNVTINGVVYVKGSTTIGAGSTTINGSLISLLNIDVNGNLTVNYEPNILNDWDDLVGLDDDDGIYDYTPQIIWTEE